MYKKGLLIVIVLALLMPGLAAGESDWAWATSSRPRT